LEGQIRSFSQIEAAKADSGVTLSVGQQLEFKDKHIGSLSHFNADQASAWTNGRLLMNFVTLGQAIQEINRYRRGTVKLLDDNLAKREINAAIDLNHINAWLDALATTLPAKVHHFGPVVLIRSRS
jgi:transmembrane sensor